MNGIDYFRPNTKKFKRMVADLDRGLTDIESDILRKRRFILIHSYVYYKLNDNIVSDFKWAQVAKELIELQNRYPEIASYLPWASAFSDFDGFTGFNLPLDDPWVVAKARERMVENRRLPSKKFTWYNQKKTRKYRWLGEKWVTEELKNNEWTLVN